MRALTPRERRVLALGLLVLAIGLVWLLAVGPLVGGFVQRADARRDLRAAYQRNARLIAPLPAVRAAAEAQLAAASRFAVAAPSDTLALEAFRGRLQRLAAEENFTITGLQDLQADAPASDIRLRMDATLTLTQLYETVKRLETEDAYVVVDYLSVSADRSLASGRLSPLDARLELSAAWRPIRGKP